MPIIKRYKNDGLCIEKKSLGYQLDKKFHCDSYFKS